MGVFSSDNSRLQQLFDLSREADLAGETHKIRKSAKTLPWNSARARTQRVPANRAVLSAGTECAEKHPAKSTLLNSGVHAARTHLRGIIFSQKPPGSGHFVVKRVSRGIRDAQAGYEARIKRH
jgi:hypothetical protein